MMDLMTRRLPFSEPLPGMWSSMVPMPMTIILPFALVLLARLSEQTSSEAYEYEYPATPLTHVEFAKWSRVVVDA